MRTKLFISALAVALSIGIVTAQNQNQVKKEETTTTQNGPAFVDKNNDGVCDNFENGTSRNPNANGKQRLLDGSGRKQGKGKGQAIGARDGSGRKQGVGRGKAVGTRDENGVAQGQGRGPGKGTGLRNGKGSEANFVDANNNGICDRREN